MKVGAIQLCYWIHRLKYETHILALREGKLLADALFSPLHVAHTSSECSTFIVQEVLSIRANLSHPAIPMGDL